MGCARDPAWVHKSLWLSQLILPGPILMGLGVVVSGGP